MWYRKCALQYKEQGEKKYQFKNGGIRQWGKQNKNEDQQNDGLKHLEQWQLKEKWEWREEWWALEEEKCGGGNVTVTLVFISLQKVAPLPVCRPAWGHPGGLWSSAALSWRLSSVRWYDTAARALWSWGRTSLDFQNQVNLEETTTV